MASVARIPVRFSYEDRTQDWHFVVEQHGWGVVGGGQSTLAEARLAAAEAVAVALEARPPLDDDQDEVEYLNVAVG